MSAKREYMSRAHRIYATVYALWDEEVDWIIPPTDTASAYRHWPYRFDRP